MTLGLRFLGLMFLGLRQPRVRAKFRLRILKAPVTELMNIPDATFVKYWIG